MQIDGRTQAIFMGSLGALSVVGGLGASAFPSFLSAEAGDIVKTAGLLVPVVSAIGAAFGLYSSSKPGPLAPQDPPGVVAASKIAGV